MFGRNPLSAVGDHELSIVGGTGVFRLARGIATVRTYLDFDATGYAVFNYTLLLGHVDEPAGAAPSEGKIAMVQAAGGIFAGSTASCITTPLDTIKTRLQVMGHEKKQTIREVVKKFVC
ncbi:uncharacterized protein [Henckelia pumila]|uniref:uncharacterized protein isoform X1 n=1 Tax=Henckelia pumila TaxID=405737 RepID=UPI003C6E17C7